MDAFVFWLAEKSIAIALGKHKATKKFPETPDSITLP
jgi:hypothetical protein